MLYLIKRNEVTRKGRLQLPKKTSAHYRSDMHRPRSSPHRRKNPSRNTMNQKFQVDDKTHMNLHHRRARCDGGDWSRENISVVYKRAHKFWNKLCDGDQTVRHVSRVVIALIKWIFGKRSWFMKLVSTANGRTGLIIHGANYVPTDAQCKAFIELFDGMSPGQIISWINNTWLNPKYKLALIQQ